MQRNIPKASQTRYKYKLCIRLRAASRSPLSALGSHWLEILSLIWKVLPHGVTPSRVPLAFVRVAWLSSSGPRVARGGTKGLLAPTGWPEGRKRDLTKETKRSSPAEDSRVRNASNQNKDRAKRCGHSGLPGQVAAAIPCNRRSEGHTNLQQPAHRLLLSFFFYHGAR